MTLAIFGALGGGYLLARRVARPLYELVLRAESAAGGTRVEVTASDEIGALSEHVTRLARRIEESSAALAISARGWCRRRRCRRSARWPPRSRTSSSIRSPASRRRCSCSTATNPTPEVHETVTAVDAEVRRVEADGAAADVASRGRCGAAAAARRCSTSCCRGWCRRRSAEAEAQGVRVVPALNGVRDADRRSRAARCRCWST